MTTAVLKNARFWRGSYDLSGKTSRLSLQLTRPALLDTGISQPTAHTYVPGLKSAALDHSGFLDLGATSIEAYLAAEHGLADQPIVAAFPDGAVGAGCFVFAGIPADLETGGKVGELLAFSLRAQGSGSIGRGMLLEPGATARTATFNGTAVQTGAVASGQKLYAALLVLSVSAADTLDVIVSSDALEAFGTPTTRATFTQATATGYELLTVAGPITDDWWRVGVTIAGTDPSFLFVVAIGIGT